MIGRNAVLPEHMTGKSEWETITAEDEWLCGRPLTRRFTNFLEASLRGFAVAERLEQMEDINMPVYATYQQWRRGKSVDAIAADTGISAHAVRARLARAREFMGDVEAPQTAGEGLRWLEIHDPFAHSVWILAGHGWTQERISKALDTSERTVRRAMIRAREKCGRLDRDSMRRDRRREIAA